MPILSHSYVNVNHNSSQCATLWIIVKLVLIVAIPGQVCVDVVTLAINNKQMHCAVICEQATRLPLYQYSRTSG